ncbi:MAG TPA: hypothetical protein VE155_07195 [Pseudonocardiaceae bacterium]|nr:hypothetical protein [Pseudonocardiaceae bacterium]
MTKLLCQRVTGHAREDNLENLKVLGARVSASRGDGTCDVICGHHATHTVDEVPCCGACIARVLADHQGMGVVQEITISIWRLASGKAKSPSYVQATSYDVSCLPPHYRARRHFTLTVEYRGDDLWAVCRYGHCYGENGAQEYERSPSNRDDDFLTRFRFPLTRALQIARERAPDLTVNGYSVADALANGPEWR